MKDSLKKLGIKKGSTLALLLSFALIPLPGLKDSPTGMMWVHDHATRYIVQNRHAILATRSEGIETQKLMNSQFSVYLLQDRRLKVMESSRLTEVEKHIELQKIMDELEKHDRRLDKSLERLEHLDSFLSGYRIAHNN